MKPSAKPAAPGQRPQLTSATPVHVPIHDVAPRAEPSTVVAPVPTPAVPVRAMPGAPAHAAPVPATDLLKKGPTPPAAAAPPAPGSQGAPVSPPVLTPAGAPPTSAAGARAPLTPSRFGISVQSGQSAGQRYRLGGAGCMVGRSRGAILFPDDIYVSPHHGTFILRDGKLFVRDEGSVSGVFVTTQAQEALAPGAFFAAGERLFRFLGAVPAAPAPQPGRPLTYGSPVPQSQTLYGLEEVIVGGRAGRTIVSGGPLLTIGQQQCDLSFPGDPTLAPRHCEVAPTPRGTTLRDLSGGLGTFIRLAHGQERALNPGDRVRIGQHVLQVEAVA